MNLPQVYMCSKTTFKLVRKVVRNGTCKSFPGGSVVKNLPAKAGDMG